MMKAIRAGLVFLIVAAGAVAARSVPDASTGSAGAAAGNPSPVTIRFRDQSFVDGAKIRLGDISRILAGGEHAVAELETLEVARSAGFGHSRMLDTDVLFARYLRPLSHRFAFEYDSKVIRISTRAEKLPIDSLARLVDSLVSAMPRHSGEIRRWEIARAPAEILVPLSPHRLELSFSGAKRKGKVDLTLAIRDESRVLRNIPITLNLRVEEPVLVATARIERGMALDAGNVAVRMRETTRMNGSNVGNPARMIGLLAKVTLNPGRIVTPRMVAIPPTVKRGQEAKIVYRNGSVSVTADAVCRQDGLAGEIIMAKSLASHRLMRVRVMEEGWLEPVPGG